MPGCRIALEAVAGEIIQRYLREGNYAAARHVLDMWQTKFNGVAHAIRGRLASSASKRPPASNWPMPAASQPKAIRPRPQSRQPRARDLANARNRPAVLNQIASEFPFVTVGVLEASPRTPNDESTIGQRFVPAGSPHSCSPKNTISAPRAAFTVHPSENSTSTKVAAICRSNSRSTPDGLYCRYALALLALDGHARYAVLPRRLCLTLRQRFDRPR